MLPGMQSVEIRDAVDAEQHGLAIDHERGRAVLERSLDDERIPVGPVMAVPGEQPYALAFAMDDQPIAVMLDLMDPVLTRGDRGRSGEDAWLE
jgi:hypothetical protein